MHLLLPLLLVVLLGLALPEPAAAILYITRDQVISADLQDSAQIGYASASDQAARRNPASPTVTVTASGRLPGSGTTNRGTGVYNASVLNLNGGYVAGIGLTDNATANVTGGTFGSLSVSKNATLNLGGGSTEPALGSRSLSVNDQGTVQMTGGYVNGSLETYHIVLQPSGLVLWASPVISLANGTIADDVLARSRSRFTSRQFHIGGDLEATQESHVDGDLTIIAGAVRLADQSTLSLSTSEVLADLSVQGGAIATLDIVEVGGVARADGGGRIVADGLRVTGDALVGGGFLAMTDGLVGGDVRVTGTGGEARLEGVNVDGNLLAAGDGILSISGNGSAVNHDVTARDHASITIGTSLDADDPGLSGRVTAEGASSVLMLGGTIFGSAAGDAVGVNGSSTVTLRGGSVSGNVVASENGSLRLEGSYLAGGVLQAIDAASVVITGGEILSDLASFDTSRLVVEAGQVWDEPQTQGASTLVVRGGVLCSGVSAFEDSSLSIDGGQMELALLAAGRSDVAIRDGFVGSDLLGLDDAVVDMEGGYVEGQAIFRGRSSLDLRGGVIAGDPNASDTDEGLCVIDPVPMAALAARRALAAPVAASVPALIAEGEAAIRIHGADLASTLLDASYAGTSSLYELSGTLADGAPLAGIRVALANGTGARLELVPAPEPGAIAGVAACVVLGCRSGRRRPTRRS